MCPCEQSGKKRLCPLQLKVLLAEQIKALAPFEKLQRVELYALFVDDWIEREADRLQLAGQPQLRDAGSGSAQRANFKAAVYEFSCRLAFSMFEHSVDPFAPSPAAVGPATEAPPAPSEEEAALLAGLRRPKVQRAQRTRSRAAGLLAALMPTAGAAGPDSSWTMCRLRKSSSWLPLLRCETCGKPGSLPLSVQVPICMAAPLSPSLFSFHFLFHPFAVAAVGISAHSTPPAPSLTLTHLLALNTRRQSQQPQGRRQPS